MLACVHLEFCVCTRCCGLFDLWVCFSVFLWALGCTHLRNPERDGHSWGNTPCVACDPLICLHSHRDVRHSLPHSPSQSPPPPPPPWASRVAQMDGVCINSPWMFLFCFVFFPPETVYATVETLVLNIESCELKTASEANQHHSLFAKSSISSCLIHRTLVFITPHLLRPRRWPRRGT